MLDFREDLKKLLEGITYTNELNESKVINVYFETDRDEKGRIIFKTPALIIRGISGTITPASIGWNIYTSGSAVDVSLYLKVRSSDYDALTVRKEISDQLDALIKANASSYAGLDYLKVSSVNDRDYIEEKGTLRRDFRIEGLIKEV